MAFDFSDIQVLETIREATTRGIGTVQPYRSPVGVTPDNIRSRKPMAEDEQDIKIVRDTGSLMSKSPSVLSEAPVAAYEIEIYVDYGMLFRLYRGQKGALMIRPLLQQLAEIMGLRFGDGPNLVKAHHLAQNCIKDAFLMRNTIIQRSSERSVPFPILAIVCRLKDEVGPRFKVCRHLLKDHRGIGIVITKAMSDLFNRTGFRVVKSDSDGNHLLEEGPVKIPSITQLNHVTYFEGCYFFSLSRVSNKHPLYTQRGPCKPLIHDDVVINVWTNIDDAIDVLSKHRIATLVHVSNDMVIINDKLVGQAPSEAWAALSLCPHFGLYIMNAVKTLMNEQHYAFNPINDEFMLVSKMSGPVVKIWSDDDSDSQSLGVKSEKHKFEDNKSDEELGALDIQSRIIVLPLEPQDLAPTIVKNNAPPISSHTNLLLASLGDVYHFESQSVPPPVQELPIEDEPSPVNVSVLPNEKDQRLSVLESRLESLGGNVNAMIEQMQQLSQIILRSQIKKKAKEVIQEEPQQTKVEAPESPLSTSDDSDLEPLEDQEIQPANEDVTSESDKQHLILDAVNEYEFEDM